MKKILWLAGTLCLLLINPKPACGWIKFLDGTILPADDPTLPLWQSFTDGQADNTAVVDFVEPDSSINQALQITTGTGTADEWYVIAFLNTEQSAGARLRLTDFPPTGKINLLDVTTRSTLNSPAPSVTLVDGRYKLWNYVLADTEILDLGPAVNNEWHTAYLWARNDGKVKLWWDGRLVFDGTAPLVNPFDGYMEWGCGSWQYSAAVTAQFDWVGWDNDSSDLPIALSTVPAHGTSYNTNTSFSFTVIDTNGIAGNAFRISLNGVDRTGDLLISGTNTNRQGSLAGLLPNQLYHVALTLTDLATNTSSYTIDFDTINQNNFTFEAEDWNFTNGMFLDTVELSSIPGPNNYLDQGDTWGIDELDTDIYLTNSMHVYRTSSPVGTEATGDVLRQKFIDAQVVDPNVADYDVGWTETGEWLNYTRTFPAGSYYIYGRLSSGVDGPFEVSLAKVAGATTTNQTTTFLGSFKGDFGHGWQLYSFIPLTDAQSNRVVVSLGGVETLRVTASSATSYNANFYMLVPVPILEIALLNRQAVVSWATNPPNFVLQATPTLVPAAWADVTNRVTIVNGRNTVTNDLSGASKFFRLRQ